MTDTTPNRGQQIGVSSGVGTFDPGTPFTYTFGCGDDVLGQGSGTVGANGSADFDFTIPSDAPAGTCAFTISGTLNGVANQVVVPVQVQGDGTGPGTTGPGTTGPLGLPRTGSAEIIPLTAAGIGLVLGGAGLAISARRRRGQVAGPTGLA